VITLDVFTRMMIPGFVGALLLAVAMVLDIIDRRASRKRPR